ILPSGVMAMFRTTPPPEGMSFCANVFVVGSKRTKVLGAGPDSLYQIWPSGVAPIPYGREPSPPGERHSSTLPVRGSKWPRKPRVTALRIEPADEVRFLRSEPEDSGGIDNRGVGIFDPHVVPAVLGHHAGLRIQLADVGLVVGREPDVAVVVGHQAMRAGVAR